MIWHNLVPLFFAISGLGLATSVTSPLGFEAGILLMFVACLIWMRRIGHR